MILTDETKEILINLIKEDKYKEALNELSRLIKLFEEEEPIFGPNGF